MKRLQKLLKLTMIPSLIPPKNIKMEERIEWFRQKLQSSTCSTLTGIWPRSHFTVGCLNSWATVAWYSSTWHGLRRSCYSARSNSLPRTASSKTNPKACLVIISTSLDSITGYRILKPLLEHGFRILATSPDLPFLSKNTLSWELAHRNEKRYKRPWFCSIVSKLVRSD